MRLEKIKIANETDKPPYYWRPLMPIVAFCLKRGCKLDYGTPEKPFQTDRDGVSSCRLIGPVKIREILDHFELPEHYETDEELISYSKFRSHIHLISEQDYQVVLKKRTERKERFDKRIIAARKNSERVLGS